LADMQRRVNAFADVTGQIPAFESLDEQLKRVFGSGIQYLTTTAREAAVGRIRPETGLLAVLVRLTASLENSLYQKIFMKALEDKNFASSLTSIKDPQSAAKVARQLEQIGISRRDLLPVAASEVGRAARGDNRVDIPGMAQAPVVPRETAASMLRALPPAPPTRGYEANLRLPSAPLKSSGNKFQDVPLMYPALFPNDPISGMLEQRRAQMQQGPQPVAQENQ